MVEKRRDGHNLSQRAMQKGRRRRIRRHINRQCPKQTLVGGLILRQRRLEAPRGNGGREYTGQHVLGITEIGWGFHDCAVGIAERRALTQITARIKHLAHSPANLRAKAGKTPLIAVVSNGPPIPIVRLIGLSNQIGLVFKQRQDDFGAHTVVEGLPEQRHRKRVAPAGHIHLEGGEIATRLPDEGLNGHTVEISRIHQLIHAQRAYRRDCGRRAGRHSGRNRRLGSQRGSGRHGQRRRDGRRWWSIADRALYQTRNPASHDPDAEHHHNHEDGRDSWWR